MFKEGDVVIYTVYGICRVKEIKSIFFNGNNNDFYILVPLNEVKTELTIPTNNPIISARIKSLLSKEDIENIINSISSIDTFWIDNDNERKKEFSELVKLGNREKTISLIKSIKKHQYSLRDKNRKLHSSDEQALQDAEKLILDEFSYVLNENRYDLALKLDEEILKSIE